MSEPRTPAAGALGGSQLLMETLELCYTAPDVAVIDQCTFTNVSNEKTRVMAFHIVTSTSEVDVTTALMVRVQLEPFATYRCDEVIGHVLNAGDTIHAQAEQAGTVILRMSGRVGV